MHRLLQPVCFTQDFSCPSKHFLSAGYDVAYDLSGLPDLAPNHDITSLPYASLPLQEGNFTSRMCREHYLKAPPRRWLQPYKLLNICTSIPIALTHTAHLHGGIPCNEVTKTLSDILLRLSHFEVLLGIGASLFQSEG